MPQNALETSKMQTKGIIESNAPARPPTSRPPAPLSPARRPPLVCLAAG